MSRSETHSARLPVNYGEAQAAQRALAEMRRAGEVPDLLWLLEHPPTITWDASGEHGVDFPISVCARIATHHGDLAKYRCHGISNLRNSPGLRVAIVERSSAAAA